MLALLVDRAGGQHLRLSSVELTYGGPSSEFTGNSVAHRGSERVDWSKTTHRRSCEVAMHPWIDTVVERPPTSPPVDNLLRVYLGQSHGSRAPSPTFATPPPKPRSCGTTWATSPDYRFQMRAALPSIMRSRSRLGNTLERLLDHRQRLRPRRHRVRVVARPQQVLRAEHVAEVTHRVGLVDERHRHVAVVVEARQLAVEHRELVALAQHHVVEERRRTPPPTRAPAPRTRSSARDSG